MWIPDPLMAYSFESEWIGYRSKWPTIGSEKLKSTYASWNEIAGYQLGDFLRLPLAPVRCFIPTKPLEINGERVPTQQPAILVRDIGITRTIPSIAEAPCEDSLKASYLAFCLFDRGHEWPEIHCKEASIALLDLESQFAFCSPDPNEFEQYISYYENHFPDAMSFCSEAALDAGILQDFMIAVERMVETIESGFSFSFPDPHSKQGDFFVTALESRLKAVRAAL